jgi:hypothetical protein
MMKKILGFIKKFFMKIWDISFYVLGAPYELQAKKLDWDEKDEAFRGPQNPKSQGTHYRPNKVSKKS